MTLTQLEQYMISEVENLHLKIDSVLELLLQKFQELSDKLDRMEARYEARFGSLEATARVQEAEIVSHGHRILLLEAGK